MVNVLRSELVRLRRPRMLAAWMGLTAMFAVLVTTAMFEFVADADGAPPDGPGTAFPSLDVLTSSDGLVAGMAAGGSFFGVVALAFWAIATATDYQTGIIRLLVSAQPSRWRLLAGKVVALSLWTAVAAAVVLAATLAVAPVGAEGAGISTDAWSDGAAATTARAWFDLYASLLVWGAIGLTLATVARSSAFAIACGVGYVLVVESVIEAIAGGTADWLPGSTLTALAEGGTDDVSFAVAATLGTVYAVGGLVLAAVVSARRDVTD